MTETPLTKDVRITVTFGSCCADVPVRVVEWMAENLAEHCDREFGEEDYRPEWNDGYEGPPLVYPVNYTLLSCALAPLRRPRGASGAEPRGLGGSAARRMRPVMPRLTAASAACAAFVAGRARRPLAAARCCRRPWGRLLPPGGALAE